MDLKICCTCKEAKPASAFNKNRGRPDGLHPQCAACAKSGYARRRKADPDKLRTTAKAWRRANPDKVLAQRRRRYQKNKEANREAHNARLRTWRAENPEASRAIARTQYRKRRVNDPVGLMLSGAKSRAKKSGIPFSISPADVVIPEVCPVLGIPLIRSEGAMQPNSPSLDKIVPELGYVPGNVAVISMRANTIKHNATPEELDAVASWLRKQVEGSR